MKTKLVLLSLLSSSLFTIGCASTQPVGGAIYADIKGPVAVTPRPVGNKMGKSCATSFFGLVAMGDASVSAAANSAGIKAISHVEQESSNILGYHNYCTVVYGVAGKN